MFSINFIFCQLLIISQFQCGIMFLKFFTLDSFPWGIYYKHCQKNHECHTPKPHPKSTEAREGIYFSFKECWNYTSSSHFKLVVQISCLCYNPQVSMIITRKPMPYYISAVPRKYALQEAASEFPFSVETY